MPYEFNVWVRFIKDGDSCGTGFYTSTDCFEECWDRVNEKSKSIAESHPDSKVHVEVLNAYTMHIDEENDGGYKNYIDYEEDFDE